jgi:rhodanese-related sulfurtransferase
VPSKLCFDVAPIATGGKRMDTGMGITPDLLQQRLGEFPPPEVVDVRRQGAVDVDPVAIPRAIRRAPEAVAEWANALEPWRPVIVYCVHGHAVSRNVAAALRASGHAAQHLEGGLCGWRDAGGASAPLAVPTRWVTRERPKIDRIACPWLIRRFVDPAAEFHYVPNAEVRAFAAARDATPYDIPDVAHSHVGAHCSFDAFIRIHALRDPALLRLAAIVRGADTGDLALAAQAPGLLAVSLGLSAMLPDDAAMLRWGLLIYDALYAWCRSSGSETHGWNPAALRA